MFVEDYLDIGGSLKVLPYEGFSKVSTALPKAKEKFTIIIPIMKLVDCPIEIGNQIVFEFNAVGVKHTAAYGDGNYVIEDLRNDMTKIIEEETKVFGQNPNKDYLFIIHNVVNGQGGLEHKNHTLSVNRWTYSGSNYVKFLSLVAHEYFHLWNVKRIRPIEWALLITIKRINGLLGEGFTSYYDELILLRSGYYSQHQMLGKIESAINYVEGSEVQEFNPLHMPALMPGSKHTDRMKIAQTQVCLIIQEVNYSRFIDVMIIENSKVKNA